MPALRRIKYGGDRDDLVKGEYYTYKDYAKIIKGSYRCMRQRLQGKFVVTDDMLYEYGSKKTGWKWKGGEQPEGYGDRLETEQQVLSDKWLRRTL